MIVAEMWNVHIARAFAQHDIDLQIHVHVAKAKICWTKGDRSVRH